ncbi:glycosyltransferase family 39 protein [Streptomyces sp. BI20]|uniref:glycosyltransferase family 39 protein n=1 Tax=Streptomyces sp. BI20 TaxID=3403460 RepID=UPI003C757E76
MTVRGPEGGVLGVTGRAPAAPRPVPIGRADLPPPVAGLPGWALALGLFLTVRGAGALTVALGAWASGRRPLTVLGGSWDSRWYLSIVTHGYGRTQIWPELDSVQSDLAFFPLFPGLTRLLCAVTGMPPMAAGLLVAWAAAAAAAVGVYQVARRVGGTRTAVLSVLLWSALPHAVVLGIAYTEPLLTACAAWALYAVLRGWWGWAAVAAVLAGLTRPTGIAVAAAVSVAALCAVVAARGRARPGIWAAGLCAPAGWAAYVLAVGARRGDLWGGYFAVQADWGSRFDFGRGVVTSVARLAADPGRAPIVTLTVPLVLAGVVWSAVALARTRPLPPLPVLVYTGVLLLIAFGGAGFFESRPRFLLPAFPLLLPAAWALGRARRRTAVAVVGGLAAVSCGWGAYLLLGSGLPL